MSGRKNLLMGAALLIPIVIVFLITYRSARVESDLIDESLHHQAEVIAHGLAASLNVGIMHATWSAEAVQDLLNANATESGALLIYITSPEGLFAASESRLSPEDLPGDLFSPSFNAQIPGDGLFIREPGLFVYQRPVRDLPEPGEGRPFGRHMMGRYGARSIFPTGTRITVVLDAAASYYLKGHHLRMNLAMGLLLMVTIAGIGGWGFWSQKAREAATALARTESYAREIVTRMPAGLILCNPEGRIAVTNASASAILGMPEDRLRGMSAQDIFPEQLLLCDSLRNGIDHPVTEGDMEVDGRRLKINLSATPLPGEGSEPGGFLILFQDITELETLRDQLAQSERLAELGRLSSTVAHEIRNPLSSIRGLAQLLAGKVPGEQGAMMEAIIREVDRLNSVVSGLLSYARQENPELLDWKVLDILEHVKVLAAGDARLKEIKLGVDNTSKEISWPMDRDMVIQALLNLVINAIEASRPGQTVQLSAKVEGEALRLAVDDQGEGIPEDSEKLFALFETSKESGTGLGLPMVRKVARLHGGRATLRPNQGGGTRAAIEIPRRGGA
ncbi:MAG: ATP-binding protein [bacterium]|nr:ATP-binding protein [bacterium]